MCKESLLTTQQRNVKSSARFLREAHGTIPRQFCCRLVRAGMGRCRFVSDENLQALKERLLPRPEGNGIQISLAIQDAVG
ncbi:MAG: hypothetical protein EXS36_08525 [Pedosphaera sp.]|nr:hypothetical protein [Pedosphaera sp.]